MKPFYQHILCIGFLLEGELVRTVLQEHSQFIFSVVSCGQPSLRPLMYYSCRNEAVTYTCHDSQVKIIQWVVKPHVPESDPIIFAASQTVSPEGSEPVSRTPVVATLTSIMNRRGIM